MKQIRYQQLQRQLDNLCLELNTRNNASLSMLCELHTQIDWTRKQLAKIESENSNMKYAVLVYQAGIANVFKVECLNMASFGREATLLVQGSFIGCEAFARGIAAAGVSVATMACNMAGDITNEKWSDNLDEQPFSDKFNPVFSKVNSKSFGELLNL